MEKERTILMDPKVGEDDRNDKEETLCDEAHNTWVVLKDKVDLDRARRDQTLHLLSRITAARDRLLQMGSKWNRLRQQKENFLLLPFPVWARFVLPTLPVSLPTLPVAFLSPPSLCL